MVNIVKKIEPSTEDIKKVEQYAKNTMQTWASELKPLATHLATGVAANMGMIKLLGGAEFIPAASAASSVASGILDKQYNITHPFPKVVVGSACYVGTAMLTSKQIPLQEAIITGIGTAVISEIISKMDFNKMY